MRHAPLKDRLRWHGHTPLGDWPDLGSIRAHRARWLRVRRGQHLGPPMSGMGTAVTAWYRNEVRRMW